MKIEVGRAQFGEIEAMRDLYRQEANCQIIHDSVLGRGIGDAYVIRVDGAAKGYGGVWNRYSPGRIMEFYTLPSVRGEASAMFRALVDASGATSMEAQTNMPLMTVMLLDAATSVTAENVLFEDAITTLLPNPGGVFRRASPQDRPAPSYDADGEWVLEVDGWVVASGGFLCHYNPPYGDIYMSVAEGMRGRGFGSFLVQELKRVAYEAGRKPAARCNATNLASRRTLEKAGLLPCGRLLVGEIDGVRLGLG